MLFTQNCLIYIDFVRNFRLPVWDAYTLLRHVWRIFLMRPQHYHFNIMHLLHVFNKCLTKHPS